MHDSAPVRYAVTADSLRSTPSASSSGRLLVPILTMGELLFGKTHDLKADTE